MLTSRASLASGLLALAISLGATPSTARADLGPVLVEGSGFGFNLPPAFEIRRDQATLVVSVPEHGFEARIAATAADAADALAKDLSRAMPSFVPDKTESGLMGAAICTHWSRVGAAAYHCALPQGRALLMWAQGLTTANVADWSELRGSVFIAPTAPATTPSKALPVQRTPPPDGFYIRHHALHGADIVVSLESIPPAAGAPVKPRVSRLWASRDGGRSFAVIAERTDDSVRSLAHDGQRFLVVWSSRREIEAFLPGQPPVVVGQMPTKFYGDTLVATTGVAIISNGSDRFGAALSRDGGRSWAPMPMPVTGETWDIKIFPSGDAIHVCSSAGLDETRDFGVSWRRLLTAPCSIVRRVGNGLLVGGQNGAWQVGGDKVETLISRLAPVWGEGDEGLTAVPGSSLGLEVSPVEAFVVVRPEGLALIETGSPAALNESSASGPGPGRPGAPNQAGAPRAPAAPQQPAWPSALAWVPGGIVTVAPGGISRFEVPSPPPIAERLWALPGTSFGLALPGDFRTRVTAGMLSAESIPRDISMSWVLRDDTASDFEAGITQLLSGNSRGRVDVVEARRVVKVGSAEVLIRTATCPTGLGFTRDRLWFVRIPTAAGALYTLVQAPEATKLDPGALVLGIAQGIFRVPEPLPKSLPAPAWQGVPALDGARVLSTSTAGLLALTATGLVRSTDGLAFQKVALPGGVAAAQIASQGATHWAQAVDQSLFSSTDAGATWVAEGHVFDGATLVGAHDVGPVATRVEPGGVTLIFPAPDANGKRTLARTAGWAAAPGRPGGTRVDAFRGAGRMLIVTTDLGAFFSDDAGVNWRPVAPGHSGLHASFEPQRSWMAFSNGVLWADPAAWRWALTLAAGAQPLLAAIPDGDGVLLLSAAGGVWMGSTGDLERVFSGAGFDTTVTPKRAALVHEQLIVVGDRGARRLTLP